MNTEFQNSITASESLKDLRIQPPAPFSYGSWGLRKLIFKDLTFSLNLDKSDVTSFWWGSVCWQHRPVLLWLGCESVWVWICGVTCVCRKWAYTQPPIFPLSKFLGTCVPVIDSTPSTVALSLCNTQCTLGTLSGLEVVAISLTGRNWTHVPHLL